RGFRHHAGTSAIIARGDGPPRPNERASAALVNAASAAASGWRTEGADPIGRLPKAAAEKLRRLRAKEADIGVLIQSLSEQRRNLSLERHKAQQRIDLITRHESPYGQPVKEDHPPVIEATKNRDALDAEIAEIRTRED